jgi:hypothetical protein
LEDEATFVLTGDLAATLNNAKKIPAAKSAQTLNTRKAAKRFLEIKRVTTGSNREFVFRGGLGRIRYSQ